MDYIGQLETGQAGKLTLDAGETTTAIRRRLGAAAELLSKKLEVKRQGASSSSGKRLAPPIPVDELHGERQTPRNAAAKRQRNCQPYDEWPSRLCSVLAGGVCYP